MSISTKKKGRINMKALAILCLIGITASGCYASFKVTNMAEIRKMKDVIEITIVDCHGSPIDVNGCDGISKTDGFVVSDKHRISEIMSVIQGLEIIPTSDKVEGDLICFKDKGGRVLCTNINLDSDSAYGSDYEDKTGKFSETLLFAIGGYKGDANFHQSSMAEIQKMKDVAEISLWECDERDENNWCADKKYWDSTSDKKKIVAVMSVVRELKIEQNKSCLEGKMICFKDKNGEMLCTNIEYSHSESICTCGSEYKDNTGRLTEALRVAFIGCEDDTKPCPVPMSEIKKMEGVVKISMQDCEGMKNGNEFFGLKDAWASTTDKQKIAEIMSVVKEIEETASATWAAGNNWICFEDLKGKVLCACIYSGREKDLYGSAYDDKTGKLYNALQSAGLVWKSVNDEPNDTNTVPAKQ